MKKNLLLIIGASLLVYSNSFGQACTPNLPNGGSHGEIVPDTIVNLPHATVGQPYSTDIQFYVATDTTVTSPFPATLTIINYTLTSITGMPSGFAYTSNPANGVFPGGASSCLNATGNPTTGQEGTYPLVVNVTANLNHVAFGNISQPGTLTGYKIVIDPDGTVGVSTNAADKFELGQNIPNPSSDITRISFTSPKAEKMELNIYNAVGQVVLHENIDATVGSNDKYISTASFADGIYIYTLRNSTEVLTKRMVVTQK